MGGDSLMGFSEGVALAAGARAAIEDFRTLEVFLATYRGNGSKIMVNGIEVTQNAKALHCASFDFDSVAFSRKYGGENNTWMTAQIISGSVRKCFKYQPGKKPGERGKTEKLLGRECEAVFEKVLTPEDQRKIKNGS